TLAGNGWPGDLDGTGIWAMFNQPRAICLDSSGNLCVADTANNSIRKIAPPFTTSTVTTKPPPLVLISGWGQVMRTFYFAADGTSIWYDPSAVCTDAAGNLYMSHADNKIRKYVPSSWVVTTMAGSGAAGSTDGTGTAATLNQPKGLCLDSAGNLYFADS